MMSVHSGVEQSLLTPGAGATSGNGLRRASLEDATLLAFLAKGSLGGQRALAVPSPLPEHLAQTPTVVTRMEPKSSGLPALQNQVMSGRPRAGKDPAQHGADSRSEAVQLENQRAGAGRISTVELPAAAAVAAAVAAAAAGAEAAMKIRQVSAPPDAPDTFPTSTQASVSAHGDATTTAASVSRAGGPRRARGGSAAGKRGRPGGDTRTTKPSRGAISAADKKVLNAIAAKKCRARKKEYILSLQSRVLELEERNVKLLNELELARRAVAMTTAVAAAPEPQL